MCTWDFCFIKPCQCLYHLVDNSIIFSGKITCNVKICREKNVKLTNWRHPYFSHFCWMVWGAGKFVAKTGRVYILLTIMRILENAAMVANVVFADSGLRHLGCSISFESNNHAMQLTHIWTCFSGYKIVAYTFIWIEIFAEFREEGLYSCLLTLIVNIRCYHKTVSACNVNSTGGGYLKEKRNIQIDLEM